MPAEFSLQRTQPGIPLAFPDATDMSTSLNQTEELAVDTSFVYGGSRAIQSLNASVREIAATDIPVLLLGESGTGKEVYGRLIHRLSKRWHAVIKKLSCRTLEQGELVAHWRNHCEASTESTGGELQTLFLDGIDELDSGCQKVLISLLPDGEGTGTETKQPRLISSSCRGLDQEIEAGRFRRELYFRISGMCLQLPPLRDRKDDIPALMEHFLVKHTPPGRKVPCVNEAETALLTLHDWPGNIRELENLAKRITLLGDARRILDEFRPVAKTEPTLVEKPREFSLKEFSLKVAARAASRKAERELILKALERTHWNRKRAASDLQISYKSLLYKIKQTGLEPSETEPRVKEVR
jgi:two-component system response regulator AtoC